MTDDRQENDHPSDPVETSAMLIHERLHHAGSGQVCDQCRGLAREIATILRG